ncbi:MAG: Na+/H+ antiporter subunit E [Paracoccaceae bacterium]
MRLLARIFPHPYLSLLLVLTWCFLQNSFSINTLVMAIILAVIIPFTTARYWPDRPKLKRPFLIAEYVLIVIWDIIVANVVVAGLILFRRNDSLSPNWVAIPLDLRTPEAITVLAGTITLTPGTVSSDLSSGGHVLLVHCLNAKDTSAVRDEIKSRYERRLKEIFE